MHNHVVQNFGNAGFAHTPQMQRAGQDNAVVRKAL